MKIGHASARHTVTSIAAAGLMAVSQVAAAQPDHMHDDIPLDPDADIGTVDFRVDCSEDVHGDFDRALAMMHHMMYNQARERFEAIAGADPDCAMAYWGAAATLFQPLWGTRPAVEDLTRGWQQLQDAYERVDDERERALIVGTAAFFREPETADYATRRQRWSAAMEHALSVAPDDNDVAALFALSLLALGQAADDPDPLHDRAGEILRDVYSREPTHPGAVHYIIHGDDVDGRAANNPDIVASYGEIAPEVPHALHMPSHIYVRLGDWPAVIEWNRRSAGAALRYPAGEYLSMHYPHAQDYLVYAHLQRGEDDAARVVMMETARRGELQRHPVSAFHSAAMPARIAVERRDWPEAAGLEARRPPELPWDGPIGLWAESHTWLAKGLGAVHTGDIEAATEAARRVRELRETVLEAGEPRFADYIHIDEHILNGYIANAEDRPDEAVTHLTEAVEIEARVEKHPVTPGALLPPGEALGDVLLALERPDEALQAYRASDAVWPSRHNTLLGAARAASQAGDESTARQYYNRLMEVTGGSRRGGEGEVGVNQR